MYLITHLISGTTTLVKDIKTVSNYYKLNQFLLGCSCWTMEDVKITVCACVGKIPLISNQYLLFIFNRLKLVRETVLTPKTSLGKGYMFHNIAIPNKLFAKTWWLYDNISFFVLEIRFKNVMPKAFFFELVVL